MLKCQYVIFVCFADLRKLNLHQFDSSINSKVGMQKFLYIVVAFLSMMSNVAQQSNLMLS